MLKNMIATWFSLFALLGLVATALSCEGQAGDAPASTATETSDSGATEGGDDSKAQGGDAKPSAGGADTALASIRSFIESQSIDKSQKNWKTRLPKPTKAEFAKNTDYFWNMETSQGDIRIRLMPDVAPMHVTSTIYLTELGFYDDLTFHRVIPRFMAQGGCPLGRGTGSPGYKYGGEFDSTVRHDRPGLLSMANAGPGTDGSQFFITFTATPHLNDKHTIFGEVVAGMDSLKKIENLGSSPSGKTSTKIFIKKATIEVK